MGRRVYGAPWRQNNKMVNRNYKKMNDVTTFKHFTESADSSEYVGRSFTYGVMLYDYIKLWGATGTDDLNNNGLGDILEECAAGVLVDPRAASWHLIGEALDLAALDDIARLWLNVDGCADE